MKRFWTAGLAALLLAGCGAQAQPNAYPIEVEGVQVPLDREDPQVRRLGQLAYAGGLVLSARGTDSFGGVSGLDVEPDGRFVAVTDAGDLIRGRLVLNEAGRLRGVAQASLARLAGADGQAFQGKGEGDAEDVTLMPGGGLAVSFEQNHRVLLYPAEGPPRRLPPPAEAELSPNAGLEALTLWHDPVVGADRLAMGAERGDAWSCALDGGDCRRILQARDRPADGFRLTGLDALPDGSLIAVYRSASLFGGLQAIVAWVRPGTERPVVPLARLRGTLQVDNMEAIAALPNPDGSVRLYIASDDNFAGWQRTLLLAFDWRPKS